VLPERVFLVGGLVTILAGFLLVIAFVLNPSPLLWGTLEAAGLILGLGGFFVYVGRGARGERRRLLDSPRPPGG
jgi:hypothetical protein